MMVIDDGNGYTAGANRAGVLPDAATTGVRRLVTSREASTIVKLPAGQGSLNHVVEIQMYGMLDGYGYCCSLGIQVAATRYDGVIA